MSSEYCDRHDQFWHMEQEDDCPKCGEVAALRADIKALRKLFKESTDLNTELSLRISQGSAKLTDTWSKLEAVKEELASYKGEIK